MHYSLIDSRECGPGERGFTLLEVVITLALTSIVLGASLSLVGTSTETVQVGTSISAANSRARRAMERITSELSSAVLSTFEPSTPDGGASLSFRRLVGHDGDGNALLGPRMKITFEHVEADDAQDNDGDGMVDEGKISFTPDLDQPNRKVTWVTNVAELLEGELDNNADDNGNGLVDEGGLSFALDGKALRIRLTIQVPSSGRLIRRTLETSITMRN